MKTPAGIGVEFKRVSESLLAGAKPNKARPAARRGHQLDDSVVP